MQEEFHLIFLDKPTTRTEGNNDFVEYFGIASILSISYFTTIVTQPIYLMESYILGI